MKESKLLALTQEDNNVNYVSHLSHQTMKYKSTLLFIHVHEESGVLQCNEYKKHGTQKYGMEKNR